jgi:hypothetical protein
VPTVGYGEFVMVKLAYENLKKKDPKFAAWLERRRKIARGLMKAVPPHKFVTVGRREGV